MLLLSPNHSQRAKPSHFRNPNSYFLSRVCLFLLLPFSFFLFPTPAPAAPPAWQPEKTWIFAVGVLQFDDPKLTTWPDKGRVDAMLLDACRQRGVPADHILFLKNQEATKAAITQKLTAFLHRPGPEDTLLFYYAGHGGRDISSPSRTVNFITYDSKAYWTVRSIFDSLEADFHGARAILTADCCHSGALAEEAAHRHGRIPVAVLTSACATSNSTGNWTFTQCLVDLVDGNPELDLNRDGQITFAEAARYTEQEMSFVESQRSADAVTDGFSPDFMFVPAQKPLPRRVGERCEGLEQGKWYKAKIIRSSEGRFEVAWPGWDQSYNAWLTPEQLRPYHPSLLPVGANVEIEWGGKWYPGNIVRTDLGLLLAHYDGFPASDDEWVPMTRLRSRN